MSNTRLEDKVSVLREEEKALQEKKRRFLSGEFLQDLIPEENLYHAISLYQEWGSRLLAEEERVEGIRQVVYAEIKQDMQSHFAHPNSASMHIGNLRISARRRRGINTGHVIAVAEQHGLLETLKELGAIETKTTTTVNKGAIPKEHQHLFNDAEYIQRTDVLIKVVEE